MLSQNIKFSLKYYILIILITLILPVTIFSKESIQNGNLDLRGFNFSKGASTVISGEANIYWNKFITFPQNSSDSIINSSKVPIPGVWNSVIVDSVKVGPSGFATIDIPTIVRQKGIELALKIPTIQTAYNLFLNDKLIASSGVPSKKVNNEVFEFKPQIVTFTTPNDSFHLTFHISNYQNNTGGIWQPLGIGSPQEIFRYRDFAMAYDVLFFGILIFFAIYFFITTTYLNDNKLKIATKYLALFSAVTAIRTVTQGEQIAYTFVSFIPTSIILSIDYITLFISLPLFLGYVNTVFYKYANQKIYSGIIYTSYSLAIFSILTPLKVHSLTVIPYQAIVLFALIYHFYIAFKAKKDDTTLSTFILGSIIAISFAAFHDILVNHSIGNPLPFIPLGNVLVASSQAIILGIKINTLQHENEKYAATDKKINRILVKFIPSQFFSLINKSAITVQLGDQINKRMTVIFCDIRNFTSISEHMSPNQTFQFLNDYLAIITPSITPNNGFIDKFLGDGVMAVFPEKPEDALNCAVEITKAVNKSDLAEKYNITNKLKVGIGIHYGLVTLGVIGSNERMEDTVIGDTVNTAARMESLTKQYGASIIVSDDVLNSTNFNHSGFQKRRLGTLQVKGKQIQTTIFEIFDPSESIYNSQKMESRGYFEQALILLESGDIKNAKKLFTLSLSISPDEAATLHYLNICSEMKSKSSTYLEP